MEEKRHFLDYFFNPRSIAVVGATNNSSTANFCLLNNLIRLGFSGKLYPVNPNASKISGIPAYTCLKDIDGEIDLVVSAVPAAKTLGIIKDCVAKRVKGVVLVSGGFSEIGGQGTKVQDTIARILKENGIRAIGPNTLSPINCSNNLVISFHPIEKVHQGPVSFIFQSGIYDPRLRWILNHYHLGISKLIDLGNKMDINEVDALEYLAQDQNTKIIGIHMEIVKGDSREFVQLLKDTVKKKPIIILKSGRTVAGAKAAASHTASVVRGSDIVFDSLLRQTGVIRAQNFEEFLDFAKAFEFLNLPGGNKCAIASFSGGEGVIAADICQQEGFSMASPSQHTIDGIKAIFPPWEIPVNPLDLGVCIQFNRAEKIFQVFFDYMANDTNVDCLLIQLPSKASYSVEEEFCRSFLLAKEEGKTICLWTASMASDSIDSLVERLELNHIPVYLSAPGAIKALSAVYKYKLMNAVNV